MTTALVINTDSSYYCLQLGENSLQQFQEVVGGWIDAVRAEDFVGYVNDEGLLIGLDYNPVASALFGQTLVGNVAVVGAFDSNGVYDGENHDVPARVIGQVAQFHAVQSLINEMLGSAR